MNSKHPACLDAAQYFWFEAAEQHFFVNSLKRTFVQLDYAEVKVLKVLRTKMSGLNIME